MRLGDMVIMVRKPMDRGNQSSVKKVSLRQYYMKNYDIT